MRHRSVKEPIAALGDPGEAKSLSPIATPRAAYERNTMVPSFDKTEAVSTVLSRPDRYKQLFAALSSPGVISRGAGLSYCLASAHHQGRSVLATQFNRFLAFDEESNVVRVEPGVGSTTSLVRLGTVGCAVIAVSRLPS